MNYEPVTQYIIMEKHLNAHHNLFGGVVLSWLDEGGAMYVMEKIRYSNIVTISMTDIFFSNPGRLGEHIKLYCAVEKIKSSSIQIAARVVAQNHESGHQKEIITCQITYVCLDGEKKPYPYFQRDEKGIAVKKDWLKTQG